MTDEFTPATDEAPPSEADTYDVPDDAAAPPAEDETPVLTEDEDSEDDVEPEAEGA